MVRPSKGGKGKQNQRPAAASRPQNKGGAKNSRKASVKQVQEDSEDENFLTFNGKGKGGDSDEDSEEEVFNINTKKNKSAKDSDDDDEDNDSKDEEDDDDDDDDQDDYDEDEYDRLNQLVHNLPSDLKRGILNKKQAIEDDEDDDDEDDEDDPKSKKWGKKKTYWTGDTADLEIGQEIEDAYAEEEAAKELQQQKLKRMKKKDFYDDLDASDDDDEDEEEEDDENANADVLGNRLDKKNKKNQQKTTENKKSSSTKDKIAKELEAIVVDGNNDMNDIQTEQLAKDISSFTKDQKLELLATHAPELISIIRELRERIDELLHKINPIKTFLNKVKELKVDVDDDLVDYIEMKQQLLLSYCLNVVYYLSLKTMGKSVRNHPVMKQLLKLRYAMEKINSLDGKLKYQIDRLLKLSEEKTSVDDIKSGLLRPNLSSFLSNDDKKSSKKNRRSEEHDDEDEMDIDEEEEDDFDDEEEDDDDEDDYNLKKSKKVSSKKPKYADDSDDDNNNDDEEVYRPPKLSATHYPDEKTLEREDRQLQKKRNKLKNSELMETLREEFGNTPEMVTSTGNSALNTTEYQKLKDTEAERLKFEEERFVRTTLTRQEKKEMKKRLRDVNRIDTLDDIGDYEDLEEISKMMVPGSNQPSSSSAVNKSSAMTSSKALEQAMKVFSGKAGKGSKASALDLLAQEFHQGGDNDDEEEERHSKRRRAPAPGDDDDDDYNGGGGNVFDDFIDKKKEFLAKKKEHYTAEARYGGMEEKVHEGDKRAISYEIMKNRGLTAHKSKANRNPRVKKREAYDKAVKARKGQVRDVIKGVEDNYGGELSGIKANLSRSRKVKS